jgi:dihydroorotase
MIELMSVNPRKLVHLPAVKLAAGSVADLTVFDPEIEWDVTEDCFHSKSNNSGFIGFHLVGKATDTFVAGKPVLVDGVVAE